MTVSRFVFFQQSCVDDYDPEILDSVIDKVVQDFMRPGHWLNCSYDNYDYILKAALSAGDTTVKRRIIADLLKRNKKYVEFSKLADRVKMEDLMTADALM